MENTNKRFKGSVIVLVSLFVILACCFSRSQAAVERKKPVSIRFVDHGSIEDWRAEGNKAIVIETVNNRWYRATFFLPCQELPYSESVAFVTSPRGTLNRFGSIIVRGERCQFESLEEIDDPSESVAQ